MSAKPKLLAPISTVTAFTLWERAKASSSTTWLRRPPSLYQSSPGLKLLPVWVYVRAPEQARLSELTLTPPKMCASAAFERWQPGIASPVPVALS